MPPGAGSSTGSGPVHAASAASAAGRMSGKSTPSTSARSKGRAASPAASPASGPSAPGQSATRRAAGTGSARAPGATTTTSSHAAPSVASARSSSVAPPSATSALGTPAPSLCPGPPATSTPRVPATSVARPLVHDVHERRAGDEGAQVAREQLDRALPVARPQPRDVGGHDHLRQAPQPALGRERLVLEHVEPGAREAALLERFEQRRLVHQRPAPQVDEDGPGLHALELRAADQPAGRGGGGGGGDQPGGAL